MPITHVIAFNDTSSAASTIATNRIYASWASNVSYPQTQGGITHGFTSDMQFGQAVVAAPGWQSGDTPILRSLLRAQNADAPADLRIDTGNGALDLMLILSVNGNQRTRVRVYDGPTSGTLLTDLSMQWTADTPPDWPTADRWLDFTTTGVDPTVTRPIDATDPAGAAFTRQITVTQGYITVRIGGHASGIVRSEISAIGWGAASGGGGTNGAVLRRRRSV